MVGTVSMPDEPPRGNRLRCKGASIMVRAIKTHTLRQPIRTHDKAPAPKGKGRHNKETPAVQKSKTPAAVAEKPAPVKGKGKKAVTTPAPAKPAKAKAESNGHAPKESKPRAKGGLKARQIRPLKVLAGLKDNHPGLSRKDLAVAANVDTAWIGDMVGRHDPAVRKAREAKTGYPSLLTLGYVTEHTAAPGKGDAGEEGRTQNLIKITPKGRAALKALPKE